MAEMAIAGGSPAISVLLMGYDMWEIAMTDGRASKKSQKALAARLRELRLSGFDRPLNRKELGRYLGEVMRRPAGPYAGRRVGDFEDSKATSPAPAEVLRRGYAPLFGRTTPPPHSSEPTPVELERINALEEELLTLRAAILQPRHRAHIWKRIGVVSAAIMVAIGAVIVVARSQSSRQEPLPTHETFCTRNTEIRPAVGSVAVICAREVRLRPAASAPADRTLATAQSGDQFVIDRYNSSGAWVHGTARLKNGREVEGWIEVGWFCPPVETPGPATACSPGER